MPLYPPLCLLLAAILVTAWKSLRTFAFGAVAYALVLAFLAAKSSERLYLAPILFLAHFRTPSGAKPCKDGLAHVPKW